MAKIYNSVNQPQSQAGLLIRNLYTSEQIEYKLRQKADKVNIYSKEEINSELNQIRSDLTNAQNNFLEYEFQLNQSTVVNKPLKWNGSEFASCLNSVDFDGISSTPLGWNPSSSSLESLYPSLSTKVGRDSTNPGFFLGRQTIISGGNFNTDSISTQEDPDFAINSPNIYEGSLLNWKQFEPNNRLISKHSINLTNSALGANSLYTGELAININNGDIFIGWEGKTQDLDNDIYLDGVKRLFSPKSYLRRNPLEEQILQSSSNTSSLIVKGNSVSLGIEETRADIAQFITKDGYKKVYIDRLGALNTTEININQQPILISTEQITHKIPVKISGQTYYILLSSN